MQKERIFGFNARKTEASRIGLRSALLIALLTGFASSANSFSPLPIALLFTLQTQIPATPAAEVSITHNDYVPMYDFTLASSDLDFFNRYLSEFDIHTHRLKVDADTALKNLITLSKTHGYRLSATSGDLMYQPTNAIQSGEICAQTVLDTVGRFYSFTGGIKRLYIDHPWQLRWQDNPTDSQQVIATGMTMQESATEIIDFMRVLHIAYPDWEFFLLPNLTNYGWKGQRSYRSPSGDRMGVGDFYDELTLVYSNALAAGLSLKGVLIDFPYPDAMGITTPSTNVYNGPPNEFDWMARIRDVENEVESRGMQFGIINNSYAGPTNQGYQFYVDALNYIDVYTNAPYYGSPALWAPRTWYTGKPPEMTPEVCLLNSGVTNYTMSAIVNATIDRVKRSKIDGSIQTFNKNGDNEGWIATAQITESKVTNGFYSAVTTVSSASIDKTGLSLNGTTNTVVEIALAVTAGTTARLSYKIDGDSSWHGPVNFTVIPDAEIHVYKVDMSLNSTWMGINRITALRLDPSTLSEAEFAIDYVWIHPTFN